MKLSSIGIGLAVALTALAADKLILKDGRVISGSYLGGSAREVRIETGDQIRTLNVEDIARIHFGGPKAI